MLRKSAFFDFLNRRRPSSFENFIAISEEDEDFIGWNDYLLPMHYGDAEAEYHAIRNSCAVFDVSPMRKIYVHGDEAGRFFDHLLTRPISTLPANRATYVVFCNPDGSLKDDAIVYKFSDDNYLILPSDVDHTPWFENVCENYGVDDVRFTECTADWVGVAVQGPQSASMIKAMGAGDIAMLKPFEIREYELGAGIMKLARMGFTADLGYECWFAPELANEFMSKLEAARAALGIAAPGYGLLALQACRLEGGFIVAGWDCATEIDPQPGFERSPYELGLGWLVNLDATEFVGRDALIEQKANGFANTLRSFQINDNVRPEDGTPVYATLDGQETQIGSINSSSWSWGLDKTIGNASIKSAHAHLDTAWIDINDDRLEIRLSQGPHINLEHRNQVPASLT